MNLDEYMNINKPIIYNAIENNSRPHTRVGTRATARNKLHFKDLTPLMKNKKSN